MKKLLCALLAAASSLCIMGGLVACGGGDDTLSGWHWDERMHWRFSGKEMVDFGSHWDADHDGICDSCDAPYSEGSDIQITSVELMEDMTFLPVGESLRLNFNVTPYVEGAEQFAQWTADNDAVLSIDAESGEFTALSAGVATVTLTIGGVSDSCKVYVSPQEADISAPEKFFVKTGTTAKFTLSGEDADADWLLLRYEVLPTHADMPADVIDVDEEGNITANGDGEFEFYVSAVTAPWLNWHCALYSHSGTAGLHFSAGRTEALLDSVDSDVAPDVVIPDTYCGVPVTSSIVWGEKGFGRPGITSAVLSSNMTDAPSFKDCTDLESFDFNGADIHYTNAMFENCVKLTSIVLPDGMESLGETFKGCVLLSDVTLPHALRSIESYAFSGCSSLTSLTFYSGEITIGYNAFYECPLNSAVFAEGIEVIDTGMLAWLCRDYTQMNFSFPNSLERFTGTRSEGFRESIVPRTTENGYLYCGNEDNPHLILFGTEDEKRESTEVPVIHEDTAFIAFDGLRGDYEAVTVPEGVRYIGAAALGSNSLKTIALPASLRYLEAGFWTGSNEIGRVTVAASLYFTVTEDGILYSADKKTVYCVPCMQEPETALSFAEETETVLKGALNCNNKNIVSIYIPKNLSSLPMEFGTMVHGGLPDLKEITVAAENETYASVDGVLYNAAKTEIIEVPEKLEKAAVPEGVTDIGRRFARHAELTELSVPTTVKHFEAEALAGCIKLRKLTIPYLGAGEDAVFSGSQTNTYFAYIFSEGTPASTGATPGAVIQEKLVPETLEEVVVTKQIDIDSYAFYYCTHLKSIRFVSKDAEMDASGAYSVGTSAFSGCAALEEIYLATGIRRLYAGLVPSKNMKTIVLPRTLLPDGFDAGSFNPTGEGYSGLSIFCSSDDSLLTTKYESKFPADCKIYLPQDWNWSEDGTRPIPTNG